jgi:hypothetical protein
MTVWGPCISAAKAAVFSDVPPCTDEGPALKCSCRVLCSDPLQMLRCPRSAESPVGVCPAVALSHVLVRPSGAITLGQSRLDAARSCPIRRNRACKSGG